MKDAILENLIELVFTIASAVLVPMLASWLRSKTQNEKLRSMITDIESVVKTAVDYTEQVFVSKLKAAGEWNDSAKEEAKKETAEAVLSMILDSTRDMLEANQIDIEEYISTRIEAYIQSKKAA